ncbi:hypothetical protein BCR43DRAFT_317925 [Syncephalastrum racemosum]|uniref:Up-regulated during septation protein 1 domain-containing protein n=1 Tax=Syncephalastrum racemosum TaxID=13706 RepID=A0A1X2HBE3_SYNRA|nr:hypothetical protein BCR43DRAFT_317925 [Syncephalastrum racemosum]
MHRVSAELIDALATEATLRRQLLEHNACVLQQGIRGYEKRNTGKNLGYSKQQSSQHLDAQSQFALQQLLGSLNKLAQRYGLLRGDSDDRLNSYAEAGKHSAPAAHASSLLTGIEEQFEQYKQHIRDLERESKSNDEKQRLESISRKKYELQLRAMQEKKEAAEARCKELESSPGRNFARTANGSLSMGPSMSKQEEDDLRRQLSDSQDNARQARDELERANEEASKLRSFVADLEVKLSKAESRAATAESKLETLENEMKQYRDEAAELRAEKQRYERVLKRESVMQMVEGGSETIRVKYEQQLEEQREEYEAQLHEQTALLNKTTHAKQQLESDRQKLEAICKDLEDLIRDKARIVDARDVRINELEAELQQARKAKGDIVDRSKILHEAQIAFSKREDAWLAQSESMEVNFEGILKEFDRLTGTAMEFETDRMRYEKRIEELSRQVQEMEASLTEHRINKLGHNSEGEPPTTASLRREFRKLVNDIKSDHQQIMEREMKERKELENRLKDLKHEREMTRYERVNKGIQTYFMA